jgi:hypothetical protein
MIFCVILSTRLPCTEIEKHSAADGGALARISEQLDYRPARVPGRMIRLGGKHGVPIINLLTEQLLEAPLIHGDETPLQVLDSDEAPAADHWKWVRATRVWEAICHPLEIEARRIGLNERPARLFHWHKAAGIR